MIRKKKKKKKEFTQLRKCHKNTEVSHPRGINVKGHYFQGLHERKKQTIDPINKVSMGGESERERGRGQKSSIATATTTYLSDGVSSPTSEFPPPPPPPRSSLIPS